ncbi:MAG: hypothetical protein Kow0029_24720 [Candidatus Rifleibacteriota bacterium]
MKYVPKLVDEEDNYSKDSDWWSAIRIFLRIILVALAIYMVLGLIVDFFVPFIPISWENALSNPILAGVCDMGARSKKYDVKRIQNLLNSLSSLMDTKNQRPYRVLVVEKKEANALALPGGNIVLFSGLLDEIKSENELAMILAHELGHFANRDHLRGLGRSFLFFVISAALLGGNNSAAKSFMQSSGVLTNTYSRNQESNADKFALALLVKKYGHAGGAIDFFKRLATKETLPELTHYLSTHPASKHRIKALQEIIAENKYKIRETRPIFWLKGEYPDQAE